MMAQRQRRSNPLAIVSIYLPAIVTCLVTLNSVHAHASRKDINLNAIFQRIHSRHTSVEVDVKIEMQEPMQETMPQSHRTTSPHPYDTYSSHASFPSPFLLQQLRGGGLSTILAGYNPLGYGITDLGLQFLQFDGSLDSDVGRFLSTFKSGRKRKSVVKSQWLEIVRVSKQGQSMRIYRTLDDLLDFCVQAGFIF